MPLLDPLSLNPDVRFQVAERARSAWDIEIPELPGWNSSPCERHAEHGDTSDGAGLEPGCRDCGVRPRRHQRTGITWLFFTPRAGLFDGTGLGKTVQVAGLLALCRDAGTLGILRPALIICRAATIAQWKAELDRILPSLKVITLTGDRRERAKALCGSGPWEVALCGPEMLVGSRSRAAEQLDGFHVDTVIIDDVEAIRNLNKTSKVIRGLCEGASRVVVCTATPLDKKLTQLYDLGAGLLGWTSFLGSREEFQHRFVRLEQVWYTPKLKPTRCRWCKAVLIPDYRQRKWVSPQQKGQDGAGMPGPCPARPRPHYPGDPPTAHFPVSRTSPEPRFAWVERGIEPERIAEFRYRVAPYVMRRSAADADDVAMPDVELSQVWLDLPGAQWLRYEEVRHGILTRLDEAGKKVSRQEAENLWMRAWQVTSSLANLDKGTSGESVKLDRAVEMLTGDLADEQVVVYCYFRPTLADLAVRLRKAGVTTARIWGDQAAPDKDDAVAAFNSGRARALLMTDAGGMGLNLQVARRMILVDTPRSAGRVAQLIGRCKRDGSAHQTVYVTQLLTTTPLEQSLAEMIGREAVMSAAVLDQGQLAGEFEWADQPERLLKMVTG